MHPKMGYPSNIFVKCLSGRVSWIVVSAMIGADLLIREVHHRFVVLSQTSGKPFREVMEMG